MNYYYNNNYLSEDLRKRYAIYENETKEGDIAIYPLPKEVVKESYLEVKELQDFISNNRNIKRLILLSHHDVYGNKTRIPNHEEFKPDTINTNSETHFFCEWIAQNRCKKYRIELVILRLFSVYGHINDKSVVAKFIEAKENKTKPIIYGSGNNTRDFINIKDVIDIIDYFVKNEAKYNGDVINVGTGIETSILDLAEMFGLEYDNLAGKKDEIERSCADITKLKFIGIEPKIKIKDYGK